MTIARLVLSLVRFPRLSTGIVSSLTDPTDYVVPFSCPYLQGVFSATFLPPVFFLFSCLGFSR
jgi:hypothetical protein